MTTQEQQLISGLIDRVNQTRLAEVDPDAERVLNDGLGRNPNGLYILAQTVLVQQIALDQAQRQLADLREQAQQPRKATSFLGSIFGHDEPAHPALPPPAPGYQPVPGTGQQAGYSAVPYGQPGYGAPVQSGFGSVLGGGQTGGFMRGALQTATGVAAGALAFEGIESLLHGFGSAGGSRGFGDLGGGGRPEEITNNYYGDRSGDSSLSSDIEDRRGDSGNGAAAGDDTGFSSGDDTVGFGDADEDDTSGSGFDDLGGSDSGADDGGFGDDFGGSDDLS